MSSFRSLARSLSAAAVTCSALIAAVPAQAAVIGSFDPTFGPSIPNLGFKGTIKLEVNGCSTSGFSFANDGGSCTATVDWAEIDFYNINSANHDTISSVLLGSDAFDPLYVFGVYFDPVTHLFAGLDTDYSHVFAASVTPAQDPFAGTANAITYNGNPGYSGNMVLYFVSGQETFSERTSDPAFLRNCTPQRGDDGPCDTGTDSNPSDRLTFTTVPEPEMIPLALLGLVALAATRRRAGKASTGRALQH